MKRWKNIKLYLAREVKNLLWNLKVMAVPFVNGVLGTDSKIFAKLVIKNRLETI